MSKPKVVVPTNFQTYFNKGCQLLETDPEAAVAEFDKCAQVCPELWASLASKAMQEGSKQEAIDGLCTALKYAKLPDTRSYILCNLGFIFAHDGNLDMARKLFDASMEAKQTPENWVNRGMIHSWEGQSDAAMKLYDKAIRARPNLSQAYFAKAVLQLALGDYGGGLQNYESRFEAAQSSAKKLDITGKPEWNGESLSGKRLLVYTEQGLGDTIHMARYGLELRKSCQWLGLACQKGLRNVLATMDCWDAIVEYGENLPEFDYHIPTMSLPRLLGVRPENVSGKPYIPIPKQTVDLGPGPHIGICWKGSAAHKMDWMRSCPLSLWVPFLKQFPEVTWHSLQVGFGVMELDDVDVPIQTHQLADFMDTARLLPSLDLVISIDTAVVHLAGAMGLPVWVLIAASPDWRWLLQGEKTMWYDSLRLYRQRKVGEWSPVFADVSRDLADYLRRTHKLPCDSAPGSPAVSV